MESGQAQLVANDYAFDDSVWIEPWPGHTPGHVCVIARSPRASVVLSGESCIRRFSAPSRSSTVAFALIRRLRGQHANAFWRPSRIALSWSSPDIFRPRLPVGYAHMSDRSAFTSIDSAEGQWKTVTPIASWLGPEGRSLAQLGVRLARYYGHSHMAARYKRDHAVDVRKLLCVRWRQTRLSALAEAGIPVSPTHASGEWMCPPKRSLPRRASLSAPPPPAGSRQSPWPRAGCGCRWRCAQIAWWTDAATVKVAVSWEAGLASGIVGMPSARQSVQFGEDMGVRGRHVGGCAHPELEPYAALLFDLFCEARGRQLRARLRCALS